MEKHQYCAPFLMGNGHVQTIYPVLFRKLPDPPYTRERITTPDHDFLDLDWCGIDSRRLAIISHGLEGNTSRTYVRGMVRAVNAAGWDALAWNYRGCSGEPNTTLRFYHNGATDDLARVISHAQDTGRYDEIALIGFSLGGNLSLVHLGRDTVSPLVSRAIVFSVPCDLEACARHIAKPSNRLYLNRFLRLLHDKIKDKMQLMPEFINDQGYESIKDFKDFDDRYTAPIHGFKDAREYWQKCASAQFIRAIQVPTRIINAANDPFLPKEAYPIAEAEANSHVTLKIPRSGGHCGFISFNRQNLYWSEQETISFLNGHL